MWRIEKASWATGRMSLLLDQFPHKRFLRDPGTPVSTADILGYLAGNDGASNDVLFWK